MDIKNAVKLALILTVVCVISAGLLSYVYLFTQPRIELNSKLTYERAVREVLPEGISGEAVKVSPRGYSGPIEMLIGINKEGKVTGLKVLNHRETPGLGANIVKESFLKQFIGKSLKNPIEPKKDIDAITGATISSRAVCKGIKEALRKVK